MKILIAYAGKSGTTEKCAQMLKNALKGCDVTLADLNAGMPDVTPYGVIAVGGSIRMGKLHKAAAKFLEERSLQLKSRKAAYFICNGFPDQAAELLNANIPEALKKRALSAVSFGGELDISRLKGMDKFIAKAVAKNTAGGADAPHLDLKCVADFALVLRNASEKEAE